MEYKYSLTFKIDGCSGRPFSCPFGSAKDTLNDYLTITQDYDIKDVTIMRSNGNVEEGILLEDLRVAVRRETQER